MTHMQSTIDEITAPITCPEPGERSRRNAVPSLSEVLAALAAAKGARSSIAHDVDNPFDAQEQHTRDGSSQGAIETMAPTIVRFTLTGLDAACGIGFGAPHAALCA